MKLDIWIQLKRPQRFWKKSISIHPIQDNKRWEPELLTQIICDCIIINFLQWFSLPLPWFMYNMAFQEPVPVSSDGMVCSISLLFLMLCLVFFSILIFKWRMTKGMGASMFLFYFLFVGFTLGMEYEFYSCPLWNITSTVLLFNFMHAILHTYLIFTMFEKLIRPSNNLKQCEIF